MKKEILCIFLSGTSILMTACSPKIETHGVTHDLSDYAKIKPGVHTSLQVQEILGSPSSIPSFDGNCWYYIHKTTSTTAFFEPKILEQHIIAIYFDKNGVVSRVTELNSQNRVDVKPIERKTDTAGYETGVLREVFSNFGKISSQKPKKVG